MVVRIREGVKGKKDQDYLGCVLVLRPQASDQGVATVAQDITKGTANFTIESIIQRQRGRTVINNFTLTKKNEIRTVGRKALLTTLEHMSVLKASLVNVPHQSHYQQGSRKIRLSSDKASRNHT